MYAMFDEECKYSEKALSLKNVASSTLTFKQVDIGMMNSNKPQTTTLVVNLPLLHYCQTSLTCLLPEWIRQEKCDD